MSHNANKVNSQEPNRAGVVSQALNDLSDVSASSPSEGQVLIYSSGTWVAGLGGASGGVINIGRGESDTYSNSGATVISSTSDLFFYDTSADNSISGSTINYVTATNWISSVELPAGDYMMWIRFGCEFSSTGYFGFALYDSANSSLSSYAMIGADTTTYHFPPSVLQVRVELSSTTTLKIKGAYASGVDTVSPTDNQGNTPAEFSQWTIVKV